MLYKEFIQNIIDTRGQWSEEVRLSNRGYARHHIIPKCLGGEPKILNWDKHPNIIWLYPAEHFIAHKLINYLLLKIKIMNILYVLIKECVIQRI